MSKGKKRKTEPEDDFGDEFKNDSTELVERSDDDQDLDKPSPQNLYLERSEPVLVVVALVLPDLTQCQCEYPDTAVDTFGPRQRLRCDQEPTVVAFQKRLSDGDQPTGAISLCDDHRVVIEHMYPGQCYFRRITTDRKIGELL